MDEAKRHTTELPGAWWRSKGPPRRSGRDGSVTEPSPCRVATHETRRRRPFNPARITRDPRPDELFPLNQRMVGDTWS
jgi:hypothetical protein